MTQRDRAVDTAIEPIIAWRSWQLRLGRRGVRLRPVGAGQPVWEPLEPARATCARKRFHRAPADGCTCGLHAAKDLATLRATRSPSVIGTVALWGRVVQHRLGYRARLGYPQRCRLVCPECIWRPGLQTARPALVTVLQDGHAIPLCPDHLDVARACGVPTGDLRPAAEIEGSILSTYAVDLLPEVAGTWPAPEPAYA